MQSPKLQLLLPSFALVLESIVLSVLLTSKLWFCSLFLSIAIVFTILLLLKQQQLTFRSFQRLIDAIQYSDLSLTFNQTHSPRIPKTLIQSLNNALKQFQLKQAESETQNLYQATLLNHIDSGIMVFNSKQEIEWYNPATLKELGLKGLKSLSDLKQIQDSLPEILIHLKAGEMKTIRIEQEHRICDLAFTAILFHIQQRQLTLISIKNIHPVLENNEIEAWQKLIRVLTHEIMNSLAPIISLSETLIERNATQDDISNTTIQALHTIHRRSKGLLAFVQNYRKLTKIPMPVFSRFSINELFNDLKKLHTQPHIQYIYHTVSPELYLYADRSQIEQAIINMIRNAEEACCQTSHPQITISATTCNGKANLSVSDNGPGIAPEAINKIFIPFFTTKSGGSGIGLSLCKQIMILHHGNISVESSSEKGTTFQLTF